MKILLADSDPLSRQQLELMLQEWKYEVASCANGLEAWNVIQSKECPELLIISDKLAGLDALEICRRTRKLGKPRYIFILLSVVRTKLEQTIQESEHCVDDYIVMPYCPQELKLRLRGARRFLDARRELNEARDFLKLISHHDFLTGLLSRSAILEQLQVEMLRFYREYKKLSIALACIDDFQRINDVYTHISGSKIISQTAKRLQSTIRTYDSIGRYGEVQFLIISPGCDQDGALSQAKRLLASVNKQPIDISEGLIPVTVSIGVVVLEVVKILDHEILIQFAYSALALAQQRGGNAIEMTTIE
jgi:diguanylate cyclase (GGDEF)-like protein